LEEAVRLLTDRIKSVPKNQLWMCKQVVNGFVEDQLNHAQRLATVFDGITRNSPEGVGFQRLSAEKGFKEVIRVRDDPGRTEQYRKVWKSVL
jgi:enoyl-CoA hydratase